MKLHELFEAAEQGEPRKITQKEFDDLPDPSPSNIEDRFKVQKVAFDNQSGFGNTPNGKNVEYAGFVVEMKPSTFLSLATDADRKEDAKKFVGFIRDHAPMASPMLYVTVNEKEYDDGEPLKVRVTQHEGRARMWAIDEVNGNTTVPVHVILNGGMRARNLSEKFFDDLRTRGMVSQRESAKAEPSKIPLGQIFWMGKKV